MRSTEYRCSWKLDIINVSTHCPTALVQLMGQKHILSLDWFSFYQIQIRFYLIYLSLLIFSRFYLYIYPITPDTCECCRTDPCRGYRWFDCRQTVSSEVLQWTYRMSLPCCIRRVCVFMSCCSQIPRRHFEQRVKGPARPPAGASHQTAPTGRV